MKVRGMGDSQLYKHLQTSNLGISPKYIWDEQDNRNLHNGKTIALGFILLHKYYNNIHHSHLQEYKKE